MTDIWWIYLIRCRRGELYTGVSTDVARRFAEHEGGGARAARFLRGRGPLELVAKARVGNRGLALRLEAQVKKLPAADKLAFMRSRARLRTALQKLRVRGRG